MIKTFATEITKMPYGKTQEEHRAYMKWWRELNREDYNKKRLEWANTHRERRTKQARSSYLQKQYGITIEIFESMLYKQDNGCAICKSKFDYSVDKVDRKIPKLFVDHCHTKGNIRGLLCHNCNTALGHFKDNVEIINNAILYLDDKVLNVEDIPDEYKSKA